MVSKFNIAVLFTLLCALPVHAEGTHYVDRDEGGVYCQTDHHGGLYIVNLTLKVSLYGK